MYGYLIAAQLETLRLAGFLKESDMAEAHTLLIKEHWTDHIAIVWTTEDVISRAEFQGKKITEKKAEEILHEVLNKFDADLGVNWDTFDYYIDELPDDPDAVFDDEEED